VRSEHCLTHSSLRSPHGLDAPVVRGQVAENVIAPAQLRPQLPQLAGDLVESRHSRRYFIGLVRTVVVADRLRSRTEGSHQFGVSLFVVLAGVTFPRRFERVARLFEQRITELVDEIIPATSRFRPQSDRLLFNAALSDRARRQALC
jgi:hypothetical protein